MENKEQKKINEEDIEINLNEPLSMKVIGTFINKEIIGKECSIIIKGLQKQKSNFQDKMDLVLEFVLNDEYKNQYLMRLSQSNINFLVENFGQIPANWIGKEVILSSKIDVYDFKDGARKGYKVDFSLPTINPPPKK